MMIRQTIVTNFGSFGKREQRSGKVQFSSFEQSFNCQFSAIECLYVLGWQMQNSPSAHQTSLMAIITHVPDWQWTSANTHNGKTIHCCSRNMPQVVRHKWLIKQLPDA